MTRRLPALLGAAAFLAVASGCSSDSILNSTSVEFDLRHDDPAGFVACRDIGLALAREDQDDARTFQESAAAAAAGALSAPIRLTVDPPVDPRYLERVGTGSSGVFSVEPAELVAACEQVGFDFTLTEAVTERS